MVIQIMAVRSVRHPNIGNWLMAGRAGAVYVFGLFTNVTMIGSPLYADIELIRPLRSTGLDPADTVARRLRSLTGG